MDKHKDILINYIKKFGDKYCCFEDLLPYIEMLNSDEILNDFKTELNSLIKTVNKYYIFLKKNIYFIILLIDHINK